MNDPACWLAAQGFAVYVPRYFERTGTGDAGPRTMRLLFPIWMRTIWRAVNHVRMQAHADAQRIALVGFSLGAYLALANATLDRRIRAVVDYFGGLPPHFRWLRRPLPPVLILHGEQDRSVPVEEAYKLARHLRALGTPYEMQIYPGAGHGFDGAARENAAQRTVSFLKRHLDGAG
jgi:carboxymethylenebutenolidase